MRIQNLELRNVLGSDTCQEIVKWQPNPYYQKQNEFRKAGEYYVDDKSHVNIHPSCFDHPETCYSIAFIENGAVRFVDNRADELDNMQEVRDLMKLLRVAVRVEPYGMELTNDQMTFLEDNSTHVYDGEDTWYHIPFWFKKINRNTVSTFSFDHLPPSLVKTINNLRNEPIL